MLDYLERQKSLTANQWKIALAATLGDMLDFFDFFLIGFVLAFIVHDWNLTYGQSGLILLASGITAPFGSLIYGWIADKIGRRKVMMITVLNFSLATGAMALTPHGAWIYPGDMPADRGRRGHRAVFRRYHLDLGVRSIRQAGLAYWAHHNDAAGGCPAGRAAGRLRHSIYWLARDIRRRAAAGCSYSIHPCVGSRITLSADAPGPVRGGATLARLGAAG